MTGGGGDCTLGGMRHVIASLVVASVVAAVALPCVAADSSQVSIKEEKGRLTITASTELFTVYHFGDAEGRPFVRPYFYPVRARDGAEVTSDQTLTGGDHPHHRSLWVAHGDVPEYVPYGLFAPVQEYLDGALPH